MTISTSVNRYTYAGNGVTTAFAYSSRFLANADIVVLLVVNATGVSTTQVLTTNYTMTGAGAAGGGTITMLVAPPTGTTLVIYGDPEIKQATDFVENDALPAETLETAYDRLTLIAARLKDQVSRAFKLSDADTTTSPTLPTPVASNGLGWNSAGTALINYVFETGTSLVSLIASGGSALVGFIQSGTGAVATTVQAQLRKRLYADNYGVIGDGTTNDAPSIQIISDYAESLNAKLVFDGSKTYLIASNIYLGNINWETNGATFKIVSDGSFTQNGTATRKSEGAILTKSAAAAGYGYTSVKLIFDQFVWTLSRPSVGVGPKTAILLESVDGLYCSFMNGRTVDSQNTAKCLVDFYSGVRNVNIPVMKLYVRNGTAAEGFWIRNAFTSVTTENINIGVLDIDHEGSDEALAIYAFNLTGGAPDIRNINIETAKIKTANGCGVSFIDISGAAYDQARFKNIRIGILDLSMAATIASPFGVKADGYAPYIGELNLIVTSLTGVTGSTILLRSIPASGQLDYFKIDVAKISLGAIPTSGTVYGIDGRLDIEYASTETSGSGSFTTLARNGCIIRNGNLAGTTSSVGADVCKELGTGVNLYGKSQGVENFYGTIHVNTTQWNNDTWLQYGNSGVTGAPDIGVKISCKVKVTGAGTINRIFNANGTQASKKLVDVFMRIENLGDLTIPADGYGVDYVLSAYDVVQVKSTGPLRITLALGV